MNIAVVINSLHIGGAQRVVCILANAWAARGDSVTIVTMEPEALTTTFPLDSSVNVVRLGVNKAAANKLMAIRRFASAVSKLRKTLGKLSPDVVVSHEGQMNVVTLMACLGMSTPRIVVEHCCPQFAPIGNGWEQLRKLLYRTAFQILVLTEDMRNDFATLLKGAFCVVPNPVLAPVMSEEVKEKKKHVVGAGRLVYQKHFDALIRAYAPLAAKYPEWKLVIYGEGEARSSLERLIEERGVEEHVTLYGWTDTLYEQLSEGEVFAMPSRFEGFPMALCEAMAMRLPAVAYNCRSGPSDIIRNGVDGFLISLGDEAGMTRALDKLMGDDDRRAIMASKAGEVAERFSVERIVEMWDGCFTEAGRRHERSIAIKADILFHAVRGLGKFFISQTPTQFGVLLRRVLYRRRMAGGKMFDIERDVAVDNLANLVIGDGTHIEERCSLYSANARIVMGKRCYLNKNVRLGSAGAAPLIIGDDVMIGPNVVIDTSYHNNMRTDIPMKAQGLSYSGITIEDDVWIGANAVITCGVTIGRGSIVGAGAVVTKDIPPYSVVGGVPATFLRSRK